MKKGKKAVLSCLSEGKKNIILEESKEILVADVGQTADPMPPLSRCSQTRTAAMPSMMQLMRPRRARRKTWCISLDTCVCEPLKSKIICVSSKDASRKKLVEIKDELEENCYEEVKDHCPLAEKLGAVLISP